jgi:sialate O-acetylesterase
MKRLLFVLLLFLSVQVNALELPRVFSDDMVLQQGLPVSVWGRSEPGASIEVQFAGKTASTTANGEGNWSISLEPLEASFEGREFVVSSGSKEIVFKNVLVGEVWLASGQSNMQLPVNKCVDADLLQLGAIDPYLRFLQMFCRPSTQPEFTSPMSWVLHSPQTADNFSAVGYQFAQDLRQTLQVPVGVIMSAVGGTPMIAWTRTKPASEDPALQSKIDEWETALARYDEDLAAWEIEYAAWRDQKGITEADYERHKREGAPRKPQDEKSTNRPGNLANGMISPFAGYTMRGVIWYQGEADASWDPANYGQRLQVMIEDWREWWGQDLHFGIIQLPDFMKAKTEPSNDPWPKLRESQRRLAKADPNTGLIVTIDLGEENDIHPMNKFPVARRLARWALADVYGKLDLRGGPEIESAVREGSSVILIFSQTGSGLHVNDLFELGGFTASDSPNEPEWGTHFYPVEAKLRSKTEVELTIPEGKNPVRVRYGWQSNPVDANLTNQERLPASPFEIALTASDDGTQ